MTDVSPSSTPPAPPNGAPDADRLKADLGAASDQLGAAARDVRDEAMQQASDIKDAAAEQLAGATRQAKDFAAERKDQAADQISGVSSALEKVAAELGNDESTKMVAGYARDLAGGVRRVSDTVRSNSVDDIIGMAQDFGRRQPIAFLGAAALAGFVASRFIMASADRRTTQPESAGAGTGTSGYGGASTQSGYSGSASSTYQPGSNAGSANGGSYK